MTSLSILLLLCACVGVLQVGAVVSQKRAANTTQAELAYVKSITQDILSSGVSKDMRKAVRGIEGTSIAMINELNGAQLRWEMMFNIFDSIDKQVKKTARTLDALEKQDDLLNRSIIIQTAEHQDVDEKMLNLERKITYIESTMHVGGAMQAISSNERVIEHGLSLVSKDIDELSSRLHAVEADQDQLDSLLQGRMNYLGKSQYRFNILMDAIGQLDEYFKRTVKHVPSYDKVKNSALESSYKEHMSALAGKISQYNVDINGTEGELNKRVKEVSETEINTKEIEADIINTQVEVTEIKDTYKQTNEESVNRDKELHSLDTRYVDSLAHVSSMEEKIVKIKHDVDEIEAYELTTDGAITRNEMHNLIHNVSIIRINLVKKAFETETKMKKLIRVVAGADKTED